MANNFFTAVPENEDSVAAGNKYLYIGRDSSLGANVTDFTIDASGWYGTWDTSILASAEFVKVTPKSETLKAVATLIADDPNGAVAYDHSVTFQLNKRDILKHNLLQLAGRARVKIVVVDMQGNGRVYGPDNGLKLQAGSSDSGDKYGASHNGYTFEFKGNNVNPDILLLPAQLTSIGG